MDVKQLRAVLVVAETGSVTNAAKLLRVAQPALTRQVLALERELGVALFERRRSGMVSTPAGDVMIDHARRALAELERAEIALRIRPGVVQGVVNVGILDSLTDLFAAPFVTAMRERFPKIEIRLYTAFAGNLRRWLYDGELDVAVLFGFSDRSLIDITPLAIEKLWALAPLADGLSADQAVTFEEVAKHPLVAPTRGNALRVLLDEACARAGVNIQIAVETNAARVQKQLVSAGHGWAILPTVSLANPADSVKLSMAPLADDAATRTLYLARPRTRTPTDADVAAANTLVELLRDAADNGSWPSVIWAQERPSDIRN